MPDFHLSFAVASCTCVKLSLAFLHLAYLRPSLELARSLVQPLLFLRLNSTLLGSYEFACIPIALASTNIKFHEWIYSKRNETSKTSETISQCTLLLFGTCVSLATVGCAYVSLAEVVSASKPGTHSKRTHILLQIGRLPSFFWPADVLVCVRLTSMLTGFAQQRREVPKPAKEMVR